MSSTELIQIGDSVAVILPEEILSRLKLNRGDMVLVSEEAGGLRVVPYSLDLETQMKVAGQIMKKRSAVLRELAE